MARFWILKSVDGLFRLRKRLGYFGVGDPTLPDVPDPAPFDVLGGVRMIVSDLPEDEEPSVDWAKAGAAKPSVAAAETMMTFFIFQLLFEDGATSSTRLIYMGKLDAAASGAWPTPAGGLNVRGRITPISSPIVAALEEKRQRMRKMVHVARPTSTAHNSASLSGLFTGGLSRSSEGSEDFDMSLRIKIS